jgi:AIPR protein
MPLPSQTIRNISPITFKLQTDEYRTLPMPGNHSKLGDCFTRVTELPVELEDFMDVNPRVPSRTKKGVLSGPVIKGIQDTLNNNPEDMVIKNQGIYLLVQDAEFKKEPGGTGFLTVTLTDPKLHGIVNGGHTFAAIRDSIEKADDDSMHSLDRAYVRLHILQNIDRDKVPEMAEGLNRSKQVDDPSLENLRGHFEKIKEVLKGIPGEQQIAYYMGDSGDIYITEILVYIEMFNRERFNDVKKQPHNFFSRTKSALQFFENDIDKNPSPVDLILPHLPDILKLVDKVYLETPEAAKTIGFQFGRMTTGKKRAGSPGNHDTLLPFINKKTKYLVPRGWLYPMISAFRANIDWDLETGRFEWYMPLDDLLKKVFNDLVEVCVTEHRDNGLKPDLVGKRESSYRQCYDKVLLYLLRSGAIKIAR